MLRNGFANDLLIQAAGVVFHLFSLSLIIVMMIRPGVYIRAAVFMAGLLTAVGCATQPPLLSTSGHPPMMLVPARLAGVEDHRAQFRQIFCTIYEKSANTTSEQLPCDEILVRFDGESSTVADSPVVSNEPVQAHIAVVRGLAWDCSQSFINARLLPMRHLERLGYDVTEIQVNGLSGSTRNAREIRDAVLALAAADQGKKLVLLGHSKGVVDILESLATYPEVAERVAAVISIAGSIGGSPLADEINPGFLALFPAVPGIECKKGDGRALESLKPQVRQQWLATHSLPRNVRYYSLVAAPRPDRVSLLMRPGQRRLGQIDPRNDGALLPHDQLIPGSMLLGYVNADHWAIILPIAGSNKLLGNTIVNRNDFPRDALWEALVRYVTWDLGRGEPGNPDINPVHGQY